MSTGEAIARVSLYVATVAFCANEIRKDRIKLKKSEARREKRKMIIEAQKKGRRISNEEWWE